QLRVAPRVQQPDEMRALEVRELAFDLGGGDGDGGDRPLGSVEDARHLPRAPELAGRALAVPLAPLDGDLDGLHGAIPSDEQRADRVFLVRAPDGLAEQ